MQGVALDRSDRNCKTPTLTLVVILKSLCFPVVLRPAAFQGRRNSLHARTSTHARINCNGLRLHGSRPNVAYAFYGTRRIFSARLHMEKERDCGDWTKVAMHQLLKPPTSQYYVGINLVLVGFQSSGTRTKQSSVRLPPDQKLTCR
eukprot:636628-Amphidinium_carterae.1